MAALIDNALQQQPVANSSGSSSSSSSSSGILKQVRSQVDVNGISTDIVCNMFKNRVFIVVSQINKVGTILSAAADTKSSGDKIYHITTLFGKRDDPLLSIYARQLIEKISLDSAVPLLMTISLAEGGRSPEIFQAIVNKILDVRVWV